MTNFIPTLSKCNGGAKNFKQLVSTTAAPTACQYLPTPPNGCNAGNNGCCKPSNQCLEGQGDCDENDDCPRQSSGSIKLKSHLSTLSFLIGIYLL